MDKLLFGRRILVVEDEMVLLMTIEDMMADLGCESVTVWDDFPGAAILQKPYRYDRLVEILTGLLPRRVAAEADEGKPQ